MLGHSQKKYVFIRVLGFIFCSLFASGAFGEKATLSDCENTLRATRSPRNGLKPPCRILEIYNECNGKKPMVEVSCTRRFKPEEYGSFNRTAEIVCNEAKAKKFSWTLTALRVTNRHSIGRIAQAKCSVGNTQRAPQPQTRPARQQPRQPQRRNTQRRAPAPSPPPQQAQPLPASHTGCVKAIRMIPKNKAGYYYGYYLDTTNKRFAWNCVIEDMAANLREASPYYRNKKGKKRRKNGYADIKAKVNPWMFGNFSARQKLHGRFIPAFVTKPHAEHYGCSVDIAPQKTSGTTGAFVISNSNAYDPVKTAAIVQRLHRNVVPKFIKRTNHNWYVHHKFNGRHEKFNGFSNFKLSYLKWQKSVMAEPFVKYDNGGSGAHDHHYHFNACRIQNMDYTPMMNVVRGLWKDIARRGK